MCLRAEVRNFLKVTRRVNFLREKDHTTGGEAAKIMSFIRTKPHEAAWMLQA